MTTLERRLAALEARVIVEDDDIHVLADDVLEHKIVVEVERLAAELGRLPADLPPLPVRERTHRAFDLLEVPREHNGTVESLGWRLNQLLIILGQPPLHTGRW